MTLSSHPCVSLILPALFRCRRPSPEFVVTLRSAGAGNNNAWYAFEWGKVHFTIFSGEHDFLPGRCVSCPN
jgi:hypothetical protein